MRKSTYKILTFTTVILCLATLAIAWTSSWFSNWNMADWSKKWSDLFGITQSEQPAEPSKPVEPQVPNKPVLTMSRELLEVSTNGAVASEKVTVLLKPADSNDNKFDWTISWSSQTHSEGEVTNYVNVVPEADGSLSANINCFKNFEGEATVTATSRVNKFKATCKVIYVGMPTSMTVDTSNTFSNNNILYLKDYTDYNFKILLDNKFHHIPSNYNKNFVATIKDVKGSIVVADAKISNAYGTQYTPGTEKTIALDSIKDKILYLNVEDNVLKLKTKSIKGYMRTSSGTIGMVNAFDKFKNFASNYNESTCVFTISITETTSNLSKDIKLVIGAPYGASMDKPVIKF